MKNGFESQRFPMNVIVYFLFPFACFAYDSHKILRIKLNHSTQNGFEKYNSRLVVLTCEGLKQK